MSDQSTNSNDWQPCASGQIGGMVQQLRAQQRAAAIRRMAVPTTAVLLLVIAGFYFSQTQPGGMLFQPGGLTCGEVQEHLPTYAKGQVSPELAGQLKEHLANCSECRKMHDAMGARDVAPALQARVTSAGEPQGLAMVANR
jgi:hypothetical protein